MASVPNFITPAGNLCDNFPPPEEHIEDGEMDFDDIQSYINISRTDIVLVKNVDSSGKF